VEPLKAVGLSGWNTAVMAYVPGPSGTPIDAGPSPAIGTAPPILVVPERNSMLPMALTGETGAVSVLVVLPCAGDGGSAVRFVDVATGLGALTVAVVVAELGVKKPLPLEDASTRCEPAANVAFGADVATPVVGFSATGVPKGTPSTLNVTVPGFLGVGPVPGAGLTVAVNVTGWPTVDGGGCGDHRGRRGDLESG
jgi:hypothetical protein